MRLPAIAVLVVIALVRVASAQDQQLPPQQAAPPAKPTGTVTKPPVLVQAVAPEYPPAALAAGKQADVKVRLHIDDAGVVTKVDVLEPVGDGFDEAAVAAALQYIFDPAEIDGKPAAIQVETVIHFVIEQRAEEPPPEPDRADVNEDVPENTTPGHAGDPRKPVTLEGEVVERGSRRKLPGVIVSVVELGLDAITDENGHFAFHGVAPGDHEVLAVDNKYERLQRRVTLAKGEALEIRLWMHPVGGNPYETVIEGEREELEVTRRTLERRQLTTVPGTFGDPIRVIQALPGVARAPFSLGVLLIRGSNPDDTGVYIDGHQIPLLFHFLGGPSVINAELVESLDLYPGGFPARFGRAHGGVVAIETRASKSDGVHGQADVDLLDAGGYVRAPITKKLSVALAGRRSYIDQLLPFFLPEPDPGARQTVVPVYWDAQLRLDYDLGREGKAMVFAIASSDALDVLQVDPEEEVDLGLNTAIDFFRVIAGYRRPLGEKLTLTLTPAYGRDSVTFASGTSNAQSPFLSLTIVENTLSYRMRVLGPIAKHVTIDTGLDLDSRVTEYDVLAPDDTDIRGGEGIDVPPEIIRQSVESLGLAAYADVALDLGKLRLIPGLRVDGYFLAGEARSAADPRITARWHVDPMWTLKGYVGRFGKPPQAEAADSRFGNPNIGLEHAYHYGIGAEWKPEKLWTADVEAYYVDRNNIVSFTQQTTTRPDGTIDQPNFVNDGSGFTYGLEVMIRRELSENLYGWLSYTYSHSERTVPDEEGSALTPFDQTHVANAVASWRAGGGWELGVRWRASTGRPIQPVVDSTYDADEGGYDPVLGAEASARLPFYQQWDARIEKVWLFDLWMLGLYIDVQNLFNQDNVEALDYDYRYRETANVAGVPFLPTIGIRGQW
jgi:TonB family protein